MQLYEMGERMKMNNSCASPTVFYHHFWNGEIVREGAMNAGPQPPLCSQSELTPRFLEQPAEWQEIPGLSPDR